MHGWMGTILDIDLTNQQATKKPLEAAFAKKWLGGEGFGAKVLWDSVGMEVEDGLDPRNVLVYASGPLTGTLAPASGRLEIITKSPIAGLCGDSNTGGHFAPEFKRAGYDMIVIRGKADRPVYVWIDDDEVEIRDAAHLWGKNVPATDEMIKEELGSKNINISCIGPAGENKVRFAILMNNLVRAPGWTGCGAVAGAKNLKAVAVRGTKGVKIARPEEFKKACWEARERVKKMSSFPVRREQGTMYLFRMMYLSAHSLLHNYNVAQASQAHFEEICGEKWAEKLFEKQLGCHGCVIQCGHYAAVKDGPYAGLAVDGLEYGTVSAYLNWYGSWNPAFAIAAVKYCNDNGMDGTHPGLLLAWATDLFKRGILTTKDTDGLVLDWGKEDVALELLRRINHRQGFGDMLAEGLARAAQNLGRGSEYYAQTIKGRPSLEGMVRVSYGAAIASATSTRGSDHLKGWPYFEFAHQPAAASVKRWGSPHTGDGHSPEGKANMTIYDQAMCTLIDSLGTCKFHTRPAMDGLREEDYAGMLSAATGVDFTPADLMKAAHRIWNQEQAFNVRAGSRREDNSLPEMYFKEPIPNGPLAGQIVVTREGFEKMLDEYYQARGWDMKTGIPKRETLEELDLKDVADELEHLGMPAQAS